MIWNVLICIAIGYAFGCLSSAYIVGKIYKNIDIREHGSHNLGTTNAMRVLGKKAGFTTFFGDVLKAAISVLLVRFILFRGLEGVEILALYNGLGVVLGHNFPFWLGFRGGKGVASTGGVFMTMEPLTIPLCVGSFLITMYTTKYVSLASIVSVLLTALWLIVANRFSLYYIGLVLIYVALVLVMHRANFRRLLNGSENKIGQKKKAL